MTESEIANGDFVDAVVCESLREALERGVWKGSVKERKDMHDLPLE